MILLRADHPSNTKRGCGCMYYQDYFSLIRREIVKQGLH